MLTRLTPMHSLSLLTARVRACLVTKTLIYEYANDISSRLFSAASTLSSA